MGQGDCVHLFSGNWNNVPIPLSLCPSVPVKTFQLLAEDIESEQCKYTSSEALKQLYTQITGKTSNIHKYHVLRWDQPSNTIPAHLYKDGLRHIHPDSKQARTITVREAARLQTFNDDYEFISSSGDNY
jgi:DNA (cytosine-5)-methyltransferase 1